MMPGGAYTLLITPFRQDLSLDEEGLRLLVDRQIEAGVTGIAPLGVTGENTLLTLDEIRKVVEIIAARAKGKALIVPDACATSLWEAKERVRMFEDVGADYISVFSPFFVLPQPEGIIKFYEQLAYFSNLPIILHNAKERTGVELTPDISATLAKHPNIIGIKDGNKGLDHLAKVMHLTRNDDFQVFTGKDTTAFPLCSFGGAGSFTVAGNLIPGYMEKMIKLTLSGNLKEGKAMHDEYYEVFEAFRWETNPMAAKMALNLAGLPAGGHRLPLTPLSQTRTEKLKALLGKHNLI
ncbi:MAG: 4-hydroxy-tetrahydrodipicolinate synthase [Bacteroidetes bacterium]|nr:4-hydroxy-tetrahydrodipicolinate synthase [Bacteroidota bacterium]